MSIFEVHDLLQINEKTAKKKLADWALQSIESVPWVVVRRGEASDKENIPVGIRGNARNQRLAFEISPQEVIKKVTPKQIFQQKLWETLPAERKSLAVVSSLEQIHAKYKSWPLGVGGSTGFECATKQEALKVTSDLDLLLYLPEEWPKASLQPLQLFFETCPAHIDTQIITLGGGFSLKEWLDQTTRTILIKTTSGPMLTENPWEIEEKR